jgi:hypothetical protein
MKKAKKGKARFVFEEQQVVLHMLLGIESVLAKIPDVSTDKKLQREIFKIALPFYYHCVSAEKDLKISRFDNYILDYIEDQYSITMKPRAFEKWVSNRKN